MRLIDADALLERMRKDPLFPLVERYGVSGVINAEPTVDAVEVVRCKDCEYFAGAGIAGYGKCYNLEIMSGANDYCSFAERRTNATD